MSQFHIYTWRSLLYQISDHGRLSSVSESWCFCVFAYACISVLSTLCLMSEGLCCNHSGRPWVTEPVSAAVSVYAWLRPRLLLCILLSAAAGPRGHDPAPCGHRKSDALLSSGKPHRLPTLDVIRDQVVAYHFLVCVCVISTFPWRNTVRLRIKSLENEPSCHLY